MDLNGQLINGATHALSSSLTGYPLLGAMTFVTSMCLFQLTRNAFMNPDIRINKGRRASAILDNADEGKKYSRHGLRRRRFLLQRPPEVMPAINTFFAGSKKV